MLVKFSRCGGVSSKFLRISNYSFGSEAFASSATEASNNSTSKQVFTQRSVYKDQLSDLRKEWRNELNVKQQREEQRRAADRQRLVLEKAIRLREKRKASLARQELAKKMKEEALRKYREKLARNHVVNEQLVEKQNERYKGLIDALQFESKSWITPANLDRKITEDLFATPSTTGIVTNESNHWRYHLLSIQLKRLMSSEFASESAAGTSLADRLQQRGQIKAVKRLMVEDFLEPLIGSGKERANYQEILNKFVAEFENLDMSDEDMETYFDFVMNNDDLDSALDPSEMDISDDDSDEEISVIDSFGDNADDVDKIEAVDDLPESEIDDEPKPLPKKLKLNKPNKVVK